MRIAVGADHAGYALKEKIKFHLEGLGHAVEDCGTASSDSCDYPDFAHVVACRVAAGAAQRGILICGSGIGMAIAANKTPGIRAANISSEYEARMSREHNDLNVLTMGARIIAEEQAMAIVDVWLHTHFAGGRHEQRLKKLAALESPESLAEAAESLAGSQVRIGGEKIVPITPREGVK
jgi:ribose 5-phosphate isomerase B